MSHLTISDRLKLEHALNEGRSFQEIADSLGKACSTIVREVQKHRVASLKVYYHRIPNRCLNRRQCQLKHVCPQKGCFRQCSTCSRCNDFCPQFKEEKCPKLSDPPYVCNGCRIKNQCTLKKQFYAHDAADKAWNRLMLRKKSSHVMKSEPLL